MLLVYSSACLSCYTFFHGNNPWVHTYMSFYKPTYGWLVHESANIQVLEIHTFESELYTQVVMYIHVATIILYSIHSCNN